MRAWWIVLAINAGCLRSTEYHCETSAQCGPGGTCQTSVGFCSFADSQCGERFGPQAGPYANQCVGSTTIDGGIDGKPIDGMSDGGNHCPSGYNEITNGTPGHRYKLVPGGDNWQNQHDFCAATSPFAYLTIPDDTTEQGGLDTLAGANALYWIGVDDLVTEGTFLTVKNVAPTFHPWATGQPNNGPPAENCVEAITATGEWNDDRCNTNLPAICECDP